MPRPGYDTHPKFRKAIRRLRIPTAHLKGYLLSLWEHGYDHGAFVGDAEAVEDAAGWWEAEGDEGRLVEILREVGYLEAHDDGYWIHDLYENAPDYVRKRRAREIANEASLDYRTGPQLVRQAVLERIITWERPDVVALRRWVATNGAGCPPAAPNDDTRRHSAPSGAEQRRTAPNGAPRSVPSLPVPEEPPSERGSRGADQNPPDSGGVRAGPRRAQIPEELLEAIPDFASRWSRRLKNATRKPTVSAEADQLAKLVGWLKTPGKGVDFVVRAVENTADQGYQGLFPEKFAPRDRASPRQGSIPATPPADDWEDLIETVHLQGAPA